MLIRFSLPVFFLILLACACTREPDCYAIPGPADSEGCVQDEQAIYVQMNLSPYDEYEVTLTEMAGATAIQWGHWSAADPGGEYGLYLSVLTPYSCMSGYIPDCTLDGPCSFKFGVESGFAFVTIQEDGFVSVEVPGQDVFTGLFPRSPAGLSVYDQLNGEFLIRAP